MYNLVIISSAICTINKPLNYTNTRSYFTHEQRFTQSIQTIESIRNKMTDSYIVLIEGTRIPQHMEDILVKLVDYYYNVSSIGWVNTCINGLYKGQGETASILSYLQSVHYNDNVNSFKSLSKISGRYKLCDNFNFELIENKVTLHIEYNNPHHHSHIWMSTMFYTVPNLLFSDFLKSIEECFNHEETKKGVAIEHILPLCMANNSIQFNNKQKLNVEGEYGPWGGYICH